MGYSVDLQYAQNDIPNQLSQLENEITKGPKALIIASIDGKPRRGIFNFLAPNAPVTPL